MNAVTFVIPRSQPALRAVPPRRANTAPRRGNRAARQLALAYRIEAAIEDGTLRDWGHAAAMLGVSRPRMSQIAALRHLSPTIQARILAGKELHERALRSAARYVDWSEQERALERKLP